MQAAFNAPNTLWTPPQTQAESLRTSQQVTASERKQGICSGVNGGFAKSHHKRKNAGCLNNACVACCYLVNQSAGCVPHTTIQNKKRRDAFATKKAINDHSVHLDPALCENEFNPSKETQKPIPAYAQDGQYRSFREISLQNQADERSNNLAVQLANQSISIVVWVPNLQGTVVSPDLWRVVAPLWPRFALEQCHLLVEVAESKLGTSWNRTVRVWNDSEQIWALTHVSLMETYSMEFRKVLVMFPGVELSQCEGAERHIASVTTRSTKDRMKLHRYITPTNPNYNVIFVDGSPTPSPAMDGNGGRIIYVDESPTTPTPSQSEIDLLDDYMEMTDHANNKQKECDEEMSDNEGVTIGIKDPMPIENISTSDDRDTERDSTPTAPTQSWPEGVNMTTLVEFFKDCQNGPLSMAKTWQKMFRGSHVKYLSTTVSNYRKWLGRVDPLRLNKFVQANGHISVADARKTHFKEEWRDSLPGNTNTAPEKGTSNKRAKI
ncbi:hypothetical protein DFH28DRAFT_897303 [Melampsora americana]|nr:hypothetical protein DFH28DRAFT_897303 [Melampsora americana]